nr:sigma 54-interacting transcriptional regulator [Desulfobulbaceae bacterium]
MRSEIPRSIDEIAVSEIVNGVPHGIAILDADLRIVEMNSFLEVFTGFSSSDARGVYANFILRSNIEHNGRKFHEVLNSEECLSVAGDIITQRHKKIPVYFTVSPLMGDTGKAVGLMVFIEDISALQSFDQKRRNYDGAANILGHSPKMQEMFDLMPVLAQTDASVLITGETGTGKDMIAEAIHMASKRSRHPFIKVNCGALPEALLESELFGHTRGAFTGAVKDKPGMFRLAQDGTIFLTEIGDMPLSLQVKLLSVLDDKEFYPVGGIKKVQVDVRIIAATHRSLRELVRLGEFREDLFYRLNVLRMHLPPLREREGDIRLLLDYFLREFNAGLSKNIKGYASDSIKLLTCYAYPGNVRELRNIVEYAVNICQGEKIKQQNLPKYLFETIAKQKQLKQEEKIFETDEPREPSAKAGLKKNLGLADNDVEGWGVVEKEMIIEAMKKAGGRRSKAAQLLGCGRTTLWRKLNRYSLS